MQSLDEPWTEEEGDGSDHPYYNSIPSKAPPPGGFVDVRLQARPHAPDTAQVSPTPLPGSGPSSTSFHFLPLCSQAGILSGLWRNNSPALSPCVTHEDTQGRLLL